MGFFTVLAESAQPEFSVHKLDINLWLLPGLFGRTVAFCDVGIKLSVTSDVKPEDLGLTVGIPLLTDRQIPVDLIPIIESNRTANLVFGNGAVPPKRSGGTDSLSTYDDEDGPFSPISLLAHDTKKSTLESSAQPDSPYTTYQVVPRATLHSGRFYYLRIRFKIADMGQVWMWQRTGARRSFAIADLRVNEFRDIPTLQKPPFWSGAVPLERVNFFLIMTAKLKEQRRSPEPKYLRPLETHSWEEYLGRRLSRRREESFLIYYWRKNDVSELSSFRAFLEVEKRRPTAALYAWISTVVTVAILILLWPTFDLGKSLLVTSAKEGWSALIGIGIIVLITALVRVFQLISSNWVRMASWVERRESRHFRIKN